ncbi:MAG: hypothetical protein AAF423_04970 [Pseudomonadota bacterium]
MQDIDVSIDLSAAEKSGMVLCEAERNAKQAVKLLNDLREQYDLSDWEFTRKVRIAPAEIPHSHPVLTLNTRRIVDRSAFLSVYLHEQVHWGLSLHFEEMLPDFIRNLQELYPDLHTDGPDTARNEFSTYLHIIVNWLEISALSGFIGCDEAKATAAHQEIYARIYDFVLNNWKEIEDLLVSQGLLPFPKAT